MWKKHRTKQKNKLFNLFGGVKKKMRKRISNSQIENALENTNDEDIDDDFVGAFPSNHMNKFINHAAMISEKKRKIFLHYSKH